MLEIVKLNPKYDMFLNNLKVKKNFEPKFANQINKVISNFQSKKEVVFKRKNKDLTKIYLVENVFKTLDRENIKDSGDPSINKQFDEKEVF